MYLHFRATGIILGRMRKKQKAKRAHAGRPPLADTDRRSELARARLTPREMLKVKRAAKREGKDLSTFIRDHILKGLD